MCTERYVFRIHCSAIIYAACPGGEGAVLNTVGRKRLAGPNPVCSACRVRDIKPYKVDFSIGPKKNRC